MRVVETATITPAFCAITGRAEGPFIDTGVELPMFEPHVYISHRGFVQLCEESSWGVTVRVQQEALDRVAALEAENADLKAQLSEADRFAEAAEYTLGRFGAKVQKKPGRPRRVAA